MSNYSSKVNLPLNPLLLNNSNSKIKQQPINNMAETNGNSVPYDNASPDLATNGGGPASSSSSQQQKKKPAMFAQRKSAMSLIAKPSPKNKKSQASNGSAGPPGGITKTVTIPVQERRMGSNHAGLSEIRTTCGQISRASNTKINYSINKDESIHVIIQGKNNAAVSQASNMVKSKLSEQGVIEVRVNKQYHRFILGKSGQKLRDLEEKTGTKIRIPGPQDEDDKIKITGSKDSMQEAREAILNISKKQMNKGNE